MPEIISPKTTLDRSQIALTARGLIAETYSFPGSSGGGAAAIGGIGASSGLQGTLLGLRAGDSLTKLVIFCSTAGVGVTLFKIGLYTKTGTLVAVTAESSASLAANTFLSLAIAKDGVGGALSTYSVPLTDGYYVGALAITPTTAPTFQRSINATNAGSVANGGVRSHFNVNAQTDIAGNVTLADASQAFWFAVA